jgi:long-chain acyl-CoA synthetase
VPALAKRVLTWSMLRAKGAAVAAEDPGALDAKLSAIDLDQPALMLYTSGTSGPPKGVPLTHRNVGVNGRDWLENNADRLDEGAVDLLWLPMSHIFGYGEAGAGNQLGWVSYLSDPKQVMDDLPRVRPHVFMSVPSVWEKLATWSQKAPDAPAEFARVTGGRLRFCLSGGAGLDRGVKDFFFSQDVLLLEGYGLTECSPTLTLNRPGAFRFDSVGQPLPSVELKLGDDGEILARGPSIFGGYHDSPDATAAAFDEDGFFRTGDLGRFTEDGFLQIIGRKKDILVTAGGKNVAPTNLETRFAADPYVTQVVVYGDARKYLVAGVWIDAAAVAKKLDGVAADERLAARDALVQSRIDRVNAQLARFETIKKFVVIDEPLTVEDGLLTPTLKIRRKAIYERFGARLAALYEDPV